MNLPPGVKVDLLKGKQYWTLSRIVVPESERGKGIGGAVMMDLIDEADAAGATVALSPSTHFGASSKGRLIKFYKRFGFVLNSGRHKDFTISEAMYRLPDWKRVPGGLR